MLKGFLEYSLKSRQLRETLDKIRPVRETKVSDLLSPSPLELSESQLLSPPSFLLYPIRSNRLAEVSTLTSLAMVILLIIDIALTLIGYGIVCHTMWRDSRTGTLTSLVLGHYTVRFIACIAGLLHGSFSTSPDIGEMVISVTGLLCFAFCIIVVFQRLPLLEFWQYLRIVVVMYVGIFLACFALPHSFLPHGRLAAICQSTSIIVQLWSFYMLGDDILQRRQIDIIPVLASTCIYGIRVVETCLLSTSSVHMIPNVVAAIVTFLQYLYYFVYAIWFLGVDEVPHVAADALQVPHVAIDALQVIAAAAD